jgi:hypothetical protein
MNYCCRGFQEAVENRGGRGASIAIVSSQGHPVFLLQLRAIAKPSESQVREALQSLKAQLANEVSLVDLCLGTEISIVHCPWCGRRLDTYYGTTWPRIADESLPLHPQLWSS